MISAETWSSLTKTCLFCAFIFLRDTSNVFILSESPFCWTAHSVAANISFTSSSSTRTRCSQANLFHDCVVVDLYFLIGLSFNFNFKFKGNHTFFPFHDGSRFAAALWQHPYPYPGEAWYTSTRIEAYTIHLIARDIWSMNWGVGWFWFIYIFDKV